MNRPPGRGMAPQNRTAPPAPVRVYFDLSKPDRELFDTLAEKQAGELPNINSSQLRRFFGEVKELSRRFNHLTVGRPAEEVEEIYAAQIEPLFKMVRSKVQYATRSGGQSKLPPAYASFIAQGVAAASGASGFRRFVTHFEAVVGFLYGMDKVRS